MAYGDSSYFSGALIEQIEADAIVHLGRQAVIRGIVSNVMYDRADQATWTVWNKGTNTLTSADVGAHTEGNEASKIYLNSDKKTATLDMYSLQVPIQDEAIASNLGDIPGVVGSLAGKAVADKHDSLLAALFDGFSNAVGTSTTGFTVDNFFEAISTLESNDAPGDYYCVLKPPAFFHPTYGLAGDAGITSQFGGSPDVQNRILTNGIVTNFGGVQIRISNQISEASNASKSGMFSSMALGFAAVSSMMIRVRNERVERELADFIVASTFCAVAELVDTYGVEIHTRTSAP